MTRQSQYIRAVLLATLTITSVVAGVALFGSTAIAQNDTVTVAPGESIQEAVNNASSGDTIELEPGTYDEQVILNESVTLVGSGSGADASTNTVLDGNGGGVAVVVTADDVTIRDLRAVNWHNPVQLGEETDQFDSVSNVAVESVAFESNSWAGVAVPNNASVTGLSITDSSLDGNEFGLYFAYSTDFDGVQSTTVDDFLIQDTTLDGNDGKGIYAEKLENARIENVSVADSGVGANQNSYPNNGIDINLKWGDYTNVTVANSTFTDSGLLDPANFGDDLSGALVIKARDDDGSYDDPPASLDDVTVRGNTFTGTADNATVALRFGEPGAGNDGPTGVTVADNEFSGYDRPVWDETLNSGLDAASMVDDNEFDRSVYVTGDSTVYGSVQDAVNASTDGDTIEVSSDTFTEQVVIDANVTLVGAGEGQTTIESPTSLNESFVTDLTSFNANEPNYPVVYVNESTVDISNLAVDGLHNGNDNYRFQGIAYRNSVGTVSNVTVTNTTDSPLSGTQHGYGVAFYNTDGVERTVTLEDSTLRNYQKNGFVASGPGLDARVIDNVVVGQGPTDEIGQNGIEFIGEASGIAKDNHVSDHYYTPDDEEATNVILFGHSTSETTVIENNTLVDGEVGIGVALSANVNITDNAFTNSTWNVYDEPADTADLDPAAIFENNEFDTAAYVENESGALGGHVYSGVRAAVDAANPGDTVHLAPGTYSIPDGERLTIDTDNVTLSGAGQGETVIETGAMWGIYATGTQNVTLEGFTVDGVDDGWGSATVKSDFSEGLTVRDVTATDGYIGYDLNNVRNATLTNVTATNNVALGASLSGVENVTFDGLTTVGSPWGGVGVFTSDDTSPGWDNITVSDGVTITDHDSTGEPIPVYAQAGTSADVGDLVIDDATHLVENPNHKAQGEDGYGDYFAFYLHSESGAVAYARNNSAHADTSTTTVQSLVRDAEGVVSGGDTFVVDNGMDIQPAVDAADAGDTIEIGSGTFGESDVTLDKPLTIAGAGMDSTYVNALNSTTSTKDHAFVLRSNETTIRDLTMVDGHNTLRVSQSSHVEDFSLINTRVKDSNIGIYVAGNAVDSANGEFDDVLFQNTHWTNNERKAIYAEKLSNATFDGLVIDGITSDTYGFNGGIDINLKGGDYENLTIRDSVVRNVAEGTPFDGNPAFSSAIAVKGRDDSSYDSNPGFLNDLTIDNVTVEDSFNGLRLGEPGKAISTPEDVTITDSTFRNNTGYHFQDVTATPLEAGTVVADNDIEGGAYVESGTQVSMDLQSVVGEAAPGETVNVTPGTYGGSINVTGATDVTVQGVGDGEVVFEPTEMVDWNVGGYGAARNASVRVVESHHVSFENLTFDFGQVKHNGSFAGILYWNSTGAFHNNTIGNTSTVGGNTEQTLVAQAPGYSNESRAFVAIQNNTFENTGRQGVATHEYVEAFIKDNEFHSADNDSGYAIEIGSMSTGAVVDNEIHGYADPFHTGAESAGLYVENAFTSGVNGQMTKSVHVSGNEIYDNVIGVQIGQTWDGLSANVSIDATFVDNHVHDNAIAGVQIVDENAAEGSAVSVVATDNDVVNNGETGYHVFTENDSSSNGDGDVNVSIYGDTITDHETGIRVEDGGDAADSTIDVTVSGADLSGNDVGVNNTWVEPVDAELNYWGAGDGPSGAAPGSGAAISENVTYRPWLESAGGQADTDPVTFYVDPASGDDANNGSEAAPFETIEAGLDATIPGDTVHLANGTYDRTSTLAIDRNGTTIVGESREGVIIDASDVSSKGIRTPVGGNVTGLAFENLTVVGPDSNYAFKFNPTTDGVQLRNLSVRGAGSTGIDFNGVRNVSIADVRVANTTGGNGIAFADTRYVNVDGVTVENNSWGGIALYTNEFAHQEGLENGTHEVNIVNSRFLNNSGPGVYAQNSEQVNDPFADISVFNNEFADQEIHVTELEPDNNLKTSVDWFDFDTVVAANEFDAATTVRDHDGNATVPAVFSSVQAGETAASPGELVLAETGTYDEFVDVGTDNVTLIGMGDATIAPSNATIAAQNSRPWLVELRGHSNVTIDGFGMEGVNDTSLVGVAVNGENATVRNVDIRNVLTGIQTHSKWDLENDTFGESSSDHAWLQGNDVRNVTYGISVQSNEAVVTNNNVSDARSGVAVLNGRDDVYVGENDLDDLEETAVKISDDYETDGSVVTTGSVEVHVNDLAGAPEGVNNTAGVAVNASHNWWGASSGPGGVGPGTGANVTENVTYAPWFTDVTMTALSSEPPQVGGVTLTDATDGNGVVGDGDEVTVSATVVDPSGVASVTTDAGLFGAGEVTLTHESGDTYTATFTVDAASAAADGSYRLSVAATDVSGNSASATSGNAVALSTDSTTSMSFTVSDATPLNTETVDVTVTVENVGDREADRTITLLVDGDDEGARDVTLDAGETRTVTFEHRFSTGSHDVTVSDGNVTLSPKTVTAERATNPDADVTITSPNASEAFASDSVTVEYDLTDADEGIAAVAYDLDDGAETGTLDLNESNVTFENLSDGQHAATLTLVDHLGNELASDSVTFGVDNTEPVVTIDPARMDAIGENNPVEVDLAVEDDNFENATFAVSQGGTVEYQEYLPDELADGEATVTWDGTDDAGNALATGQYDLVLAATDAVGNTNETGVTVTVDNEAPTVTVDDVSPTTLGSGDTATVTVTADDAGTVDSGVSDVSVTLDAVDANYRTTATATQGSGTTWTATFDAAALAIDGNYTVGATATDGAANDGTTTSGTEVDVDTTAPSVSAVVKPKDDSTGYVNVTVADDVPDASAIGLNLTAPDGSDVTLTSPLTQVGSTNTYSGEFGFAGDGEYTLEANATDAAGNLGESTASANVSTLQSNTQHTISSGDGTEVVLNMTGATGGVAAFTSSDSPLADLGAFVGSTFLNGELDDSLNGSLKNATIRIPVVGNEIAGIPNDEVTISRYNGTGWEQLPTENVTIDGTEYFVTTVDHFSTYGPVNPDTTAPSIDDTSLVSPDGQSGTQYDYGTDEVEVTVEYSDNKQVDAGNVTVRFDGSDVTAASTTSVSSSEATYTASNLVGSGTHWLNVTVVDTADNLETQNVSFTVAQDTGAPSVDLVEDTFAYGTDPVSLEFTYDDALSGVDTSTVEFKVDGTDVTGPAVVTGDGVEYDATGFGPGTYPASLNVSDGNGNWANESFTFTVRGDGDRPSVTDVRFAPTLTDGALPAGTSQATISLDYEDATSGIDAGTISVDFDGQDVTDEAVITPGSLEYTALGLENGTSYTLQAEIVDNEGNSWTETVTFEVAEPAPPADGPTRPSRPSGPSGEQPEPVGVSKFLDGGNASFALDETVSRLDVSFRASLAAGSVSVRSLDEVPDDVEPIRNARTVSLVDVTVPDDLTDDSATLRLHVSADAVGDADTSRLVVYRHVDGDWQALETSVVSTTDETVVLEAETPGFSVFAVGEAQETTTTTEQPDDTTTTTEQPDDTTTTTEQPDDTTTTTTTTDEAGTTAIEEPGGFGSLATVLVVVAVAMLLALYYVRYRRD